MCIFDKYLQKAATVYQLIRELLKNTVELESQIIFARSERAGGPKGGEGAGLKRRSIFLSCPPIGGFFFVKKKEKKKHYKI